MQQEWPEMKIWNLYVYIHVHKEAWWPNGPVMGRGLPKKLGGGVRPTSQNPLLLFMTFVAGTVDLNVSYEGLLLTVLLIMMKK